MVTDVRKLLDRVAVRAGFLTPVIDPKTGKQRRKRSGSDWEGRFIRTRIFWHTSNPGMTKTSKTDQGQAGS
jgi:hypothetical protein